MAFAKELEEKGKAISVLQIQSPSLINFLIQHVKESSSNSFGDLRRNFGDNEQQKCPNHLDAP
jgi:hypothetical protein